MSEASSYHHDYHGHPDARYYADPGEHSSTSVHRTRYDSPRRLRDVSWVSHQQQQPPSPIHDPYARWYPPAPGPEDLPTPVFPGQPLPVAHSSPMMRRTPSPSMRMPSPMIGEYMTVDDPEDEEEELPEDDGEVDFDFSNAPQHRTDGQKGARRWVGGFVKGLRKFPGLRKSPRRPSPSSGFASSLGAQHEDDLQFPTISSLHLRPLTPTRIAQTAELMDMPQPPLHQQPSPQHHAYQQSHVHRPPPPSSSPVYAPGADVVPQVLSTVDERSSEQTGTHETYPRPHSSIDHPHSPRTHTHAHSHSHSHSRSHSQPRSHSHHSHSHSQSHSSTVHPIHPNTTFTVTDYVTVPPHQWSDSSPPPATRIKRFLRSLDQLPWVENEQIVDAYFPGRSSRHRRHPDSPVDDGKPAASWYNKRHDSLPKGMGMGPSSASLLYGWPPQMQKGYSQQGMVYPQFPYGYTPVQPAFVYPTTFAPPPRTY